MLALALATVLVSSLMHGGSAYGRSLQQNEANCLVTNCTAGYLTDSGQPICGPYRCPPNDAFCRRVAPICSNETGACTIWPSEGAEGCNVLQVGGGQNRGVCSEGACNVKCERGSACVDESGQAGVCDIFQQCSASAGAPTGQPSPSPSPSPVLEGGSGDKCRAVNCTANWYTRDGPLCGPMGPCAADDGFCRAELPTCDPATGSCTIWPSEGRSGCNVQRVSGQEPGAGTCRSGECSIACQEGAPCVDGWGRSGVCQAYRGNCLVDQFEAPVPRPGPTPGEDIPESDLFFPFPLRSFEVGGEPAAFSYVSASACGQEGPTWQLVLGNLTVPNEEDEGREATALHLYQYAPHATNGSSLLQLLHSSFLDLGTGELAVAASRPFLQDAANPTSPALLDYDDPRAWDTNIVLQNVSAVALPLTSPESLGPYRFLQPGGTNESGYAAELAELYSRVAQIALGGAPCFPGYPELGIVVEYLAAALQQVVTKNSYLGLPLDTTFLANGASGASCIAEPYAFYQGSVIQDGGGNLQASAADCCASCRAFRSRDTGSGPACNAWRYCPGPGNCFREGDGQSGIPARGCTLLNSTEVARGAPPAAVRGTAPGIISGYTRAVFAAAPPDEAAPSSPATVSFG